MVFMVIYVIMKSSYESEYSRFIPVPLRHNQAACSSLKVVGWGEDLKKLMHNLKKIPFSKASPPILNFEISLQNPSYAGRSLF